MSSTTTEVRYVTFSAEGLEDFRQVILPDVCEQLFLLKRFDSENISAIGALADGEPAGALIARITGESAAVIDSIYVSSEYRRTGIGTELFRRFLSIASSSLDPTGGAEDNIVPVGITADYALPEKSAEIFGKFLDSLGFRLFQEKPDVYYFESDRLEHFGAEEPGVFCFTDIEGTDETELFDFFESLDITAAVKYSFYCGKKDDPDAMLLVSFGDDDTYIFSSIQMNDGPGEAEFGKLVSAAVNAIRRDCRDFAIIVNGADNILPGYWAGLAAEYGQTVKHTTAGMAAIFE